MDFLQSLTQNLPKTAGILGKDKMKNFAVLVPLIYINSEYHLLFQLRAQKIRQGGEISFPGGARDKEDKNFLETALRECEEEIGLKRDKIEILGCLDTLVASKFLTIDSFVANLQINSLDELKANEEEVEKLFSLPLAFFKENPAKLYQAQALVRGFYVNEKGEEVETFPAKALGIPKGYHGEWGHHFYDIYVYETEYGPLWGFTALIIQELLKHLKKV